MTVVATYDYGTPPCIAVIIPTFGDVEFWSQLAGRAVSSAMNQTRPPDQVIRVHAATLQEARNDGAAEANTEFLCFLDADDELDPGFIAAMVNAPTTDLRQPATIGVVNGRSDPEPVLIPKCRLLDRNYLIIGTVVRRELFLQVGGFEDWPIYEDWDLWLRCEHAGATVSAVPDAVYRVHVREGSRNNQPRHVQEGTYTAIRRKHIRARRLHR